MFLNQQGKFKDATLISGIDFLEDGRGFAVADFDRDGLVDLGIVSNQNPRFRIARLNVAESDKPDFAKSFVRIRLIGGNASSAADQTLSPRDPVGAILIAKTASSTRMFQLARGEGFSAQNSQFVHIGLGDDAKIEELEIRWPSGRITVKQEILAGSSVKILESEN